MSFNRRLVALEKVLAPQRCQDCGEHGAAALVVVRDLADKGTPRGCTRCGCVSIVKRIVLLPIEGAAA